jgi:AAA domain
MMDDFFKDELADETGQDAAAAAAKFTPIWLSDIRIDDAPAFLIDGILPAGPSFGVTFGPPKSLKSFFKMHVCFHISTSQRCFGRDVLGGATAYVTSEGISGVKRRFVALRRHHAVDDGRFIPMALIPAMPNLGMGEADRDILKKAIADAIAPLDIPLRMIVIDTLRRAIPGKSENDQKDMSVFVANCEDLAATFQCHVNAVHHSPRSDDSRGSGSNSIDGACDVMIGVTRSESGIATAEVVRIKDGCEGAKIEYDVKPIDVGSDCAGKTLTSCYLDVLREPCDDDRATSKAGGAFSLSAAQKRLFDIVCRALDEAGHRDIGDPGVPPGTRAISRDMAKTYAKTCGWWDESKNEKSATSNFNGRLNELAGKKAIGLTAQSLWRVK